MSGCFWVAFAPHTNVISPSITVKVQQPPLYIEPPQETVALPAPTPAPAPEPAPLLPSGGEEPLSKSPPPQNGSIMIPVAPEVPAPLPSGRPVKIAIVIDDMGPDMKSGEKAILLPASVTLSFLPYAVRAREQAKEARARGHEILLHLPMEPMGSEDPGRGALLVDLPQSEMSERINTSLSALTGYDGVNNHMGSKFTTYTEGMELVVEALMERQLFFLDSRTSIQSVAIKIAKQKGLPSISRDVFLDDNPAPEAIRKQLELTEHIARRKGHAVAIGHPHATTVSVIGDWVADAKARGIEVVPVSALVNGK
ncbi:MAG: divergent polysaccharide deacetylase family protein [Bdellovibrionales bacterium]